MNSAEQTVTWLITLGVLESPKKTISDPEVFLQASLKDGVVLCRLLERLLPGTIEKVYPEPRNESECLSNIREFLRACGASLRLETFDANDLYQGQNFNKVLSSLVTLNKVTADIGLGSDSVCARPSSHRIKSFDSLGSQSSHSRTSKLLQSQYRSLDMTDNTNSQLVVRAKFNFQQTNEDELSFSKGDVIHVTRVEEGGWWEGTHNGRTGWFPSNYVREIKPSEKPVSPKSGTLKSPPKGFDTTAINKSYYNVVSNCRQRLMYIGLGSDSVCARPSSHRIKSFDSLGSQSSHSRTSKLLQSQYRSLDMTDNTNSQLVVRAKFNFQQTNEDELSFSKGDVIHVTRVEEGGWWEGTHNGRTGWFPSNYVREIKPSEKPVSPKSGTLKSPPKGFDTTAINKSYYNVMSLTCVKLTYSWPAQLLRAEIAYRRRFTGTDEEFWYQELWSYFLLVRVPRGQGVLFALSVLGIWWMCTIGAQQGVRTYFPHHTENMDLARSVSHCGMSDLAIWALWKVSLSACRSDRVRRDCAEKITEHLPLAGFFLSDGVSHTHRSPEAQQRVGGCFLSLMPQMRTLYLAYCANHPSAVSVLTEHSEDLGEFMETKGASSPGILVLTTGLSKPFMRLDKYPTLLKELERHMEDYHPDRQDIQKSMTAFKNLSAQCQEVRKRKELELQILTEPIRSWEGDDIKTLGSVTYMSQVTIQCAGSEEKNERYLLLFPNLLLMLSASPRMSGFIYQGKLPTTGMTITKLEDSENHRNAFEISGSMIERILVSCTSQQDLHEWVEHLQKQTKVTSVSNPTIKPHSVPSHTLPSHPLTPSSKHADSKPVALTPAYHTLPHPSHHGTPHTTISWGPLEPPKTPKPWSLSCLRPAPPLRPSAALCYKEDLSKSPKTMKKLLPKRKPERKPSDEEFAVRKSTAALEEDAQILKVIEAYCTSAKTRQTLNSTWQGTDLMHNHVLADDDQSSLDSLGRRSSLSRLEPSDLSEDSEYDSIWTAHSYRMGSASRSRKESAPQVLLPEEEKIIVEETRSNGQTVIEEKSLVDTVYALKDEVQELRQDNKKMKKSLEEEQRARKDLEKLVRKVLKNMNDPAWDETNL
ncbi:rho guanine nucleotide exchange factor 7 [Mus caroli]|uniref:Rho guanine nucleotide exchange factor 7 n=2 Tax=Mus TaxID=862507 RepID=A0A6P7RAJ0_MUSCR|nr:rho guanine nucleotide exchange factor 7 [Mus caroli]